MPSLSRRVFLFAGAAAAAASTKYRLIAHRGGVVDEQHPENSPSGTDEAIRRGYWMLEVDIRESKDGHAVMQHDADFTKFYNDPRRVREMTWDEIAKLRSKPGNHRPMLFEELVERCKGKVHLMLDVKEDHEQPWLDRLTAVLERNGMLAQSFVLGTAKSKQYFLDKAFVQAMREELQSAADRGEPVAKRYFLFEWGLTMDRASVALANRLGVPAVPSINWFHYEQHKQDPIKGAERDIRNLQGLGVTHYQIDSIYERFLAG